MILFCVWIPIVIVSIEQVLGGITKLKAGAIKSPDTITLCVFSHPSTLVTVTVYIPGVDTVGVEEVEVKPPGPDQW